MVVVVGGGTKSVTTASLRQFGKASFFLTLLYGKQAVHVIVNVNIFDH